MPKETGAREMAVSARECSRRLQSLSPEERRKILLDIADALEANEDLIRSEKVVDVVAAQKAGYDKIIDISADSEAWKDIKPFRFHTHTCKHGRSYRTCFQENVASRWTYVGEDIMPVGCSFEHELINNPWSISSSSNQNNFQWDQSLPDQYASPLNLFDGSMGAQNVELDSTIDNGAAAYCEQSMTMMQESVAVGQEKESVKQEAAGRADSGSEGSDDDEEARPVRGLEITRFIDCMAE